MSRSRKKHCGSTFCGGSDRGWRKEWHSRMRAKERDLFIRQLKHPDEDYCYPVPREAGNLYDAPSDGGSHWSYYNFEHYYFEETHPCFYWSALLKGGLADSDIPTREEAWKTWIKFFVGK